MRLLAITLKAARVNSNLTLAEASKLIGVTKDTLVNWEKGKTFPNVPQINKIEDVYGIGFSDIKFLT